MRQWAGRVLRGHGAARAAVRALLLLGPAPACCCWCPAPAATATHLSMRQRQRTFYVHGNAPFYAPDEGEEEQEHGHCGLAHGVEAHGDVGCRRGRQGAWRSGAASVRPCSVCQAEQGGSQHGPTQAAGARRGRGPGCTAPTRTHARTSTQPCAGTWRVPPGSPSGTPCGPPCEPRRPTACPVPSGPYPHAPSDLLEKPMSRPVVTPLGMTAKGRGAAARASGGRRTLSSACMQHGSQ